MTASNCGHKKFFVTNEDKLLTSTSSKGNQDKWMKDGYWLKADFLGYEGLAEYASSRLCRSFGVFRDFVAVEYGLCRIQDAEGIVRTGCFCKNFLSPEENLLTIGRLLLLNDGAYEKKYRRKSAAEKFLYVVDVVSKHTGLEGFCKWLAFLLQWDALILNEDRHLFNIGVIANENGEFRLMPVFDNGAAFFSDTSKDYPITQPLRVCYNKIKSKPFSTSFAVQINAIPTEHHGMVEKSFEQLQDLDWGMAEKYYKAEEIRRVKAVTKRQFQKFVK